VAPIRTVTVEPVWVDIANARYDEGIFVATAGTTSTAPLFPFGRGLSYGDYRYAEPWVELNAATGVFTVSIEVTNVAAQEGTEVAQLYVVPPAIAEETRPNTYAASPRCAWRVAVARP
jgi:hypothetical protein